MYPSVLTVGDQHLPYTVSNDDVVVNNLDSSDLTVADRVPCLQYIASKDVEVAVNNLELTTDGFPLPLDQSRDLSGKDSRTMPSRESTLLAGTVPPPVVEYCNYPELANQNEDWFRVIGPEPTRWVVESLVCTLWVMDLNLGVCTDRAIDIFLNCINGVCTCNYFIEGAVAQLKPCRAFAEAFYRGDLDPDWEFILRGLCFGFKVINSDCVSAYESGNYSSITEGDVGDRMTARLSEEIDAGLVSVVSEPCICIHPFGCVPKGHDDFRAIVDCSTPAGVCVNDHTDTCRCNFSYNSVESVTDVLQPGDFICTVDISNAYRAVNTHPVSRNRQGLKWIFSGETQFLRDNRLCMGLSSSPYIFSKISDFIVRCLVREGFDQCVNYLDDFCLVGRTRIECSRAQSTLVLILRRLGFFVNFKKLTPPCEVTRFLGIDIDSVAMELRLPMDKLQKLKNQLRYFLSKKKATRKELEVLGGILAHCCKVVHGGRTFSRRVYDLIASVRKSSHKLRLNEDFKMDLKWWIRFSDTFNGKCRIIPSTLPNRSVYSDSSLSGFGALHGLDWLAGEFSVYPGPTLSTWLGHHFVRAEDEGCCTDNINVLELWPIVMAIDRWKESWRDQTIIFVTDNTQVMAALNTGRSKNKTMMRWLRRIFWESIQFNFDIQAVYVNTKFNTICDGLSRLNCFKNIARIRDADEAALMCCHQLFNC